MSWRLTNPTTGCVRRFTQPWMLVTARTKIADPPSFALADAPTYVLGIFPRKLLPGTCNDKVGPGTGAGALLRIVSPQDLLYIDPNPVLWGAGPSPGDVVADPFSFVVNFP